MKILLLFIASLLPTATLAGTRAWDTEARGVRHEAGGKDVRPNVNYSFDHYANNKKVAHVYVSETLLETVAHNGGLDNSFVDLDWVLKRLTGVLMLHTHSRSTTKSFRSDEEKLRRAGAYEKMMHNRSGTEEVIVYCHMKKRDVMDEIVIFKFKDDYCTRVVQLTGKFRPSDFRKMNLNSGQAQKK